MSQICVKDESSVNYNNNIFINNINKNDNNDDDQVTLNRQKYRIDSDQLHYADPNEPAQGSIVDVRRFIEAHQPTENYPTRIKTEEQQRSPDSSVSPESERRDSIDKVTRCPVCQKYVPNLPQHISHQHPPYAARFKSQQSPSPSSSSESGQSSPTHHLVSSSSLGDPSPTNMDVASLPPSTVPLFLQRQNMHGLDYRDPRGDVDKHSVIPNLLRLSSAGMNNASDDQNPSSNLLRTTQELLRVAAASNSLNHNTSRVDSLPMNLSVRKANYANGNTMDNIVKGMVNNNNNNGPHSVPRELDDGVRSTFSQSVNSMSDSESVGSGSDPNSLTRKRRKQTHVPENKKDERYWARRHKNNEAAKRSRDMRIKREKVVFEENSRLEKITVDLKSDLDRLATENKELHLKMDLILGENSRLKSILLGYQSREEHRRASVEDKSNTNRDGSPFDHRPFPLPDGNK
ncbi:hypothetical protein TCAL_06579 [Tigriopus californicus]|uniref:BZIP domain-containing protein n=1 Tax=Tigriopus californicus TaxID=6832 RepID=A0A553PQQ3_TIGCA|nr:homeobox protein 2-like [Tigriopus californicus]XP_059085086.1 homeobox protein 2-like [Tigriopus californicus]XP_059085087.1 homeobox protein 2-like [Tigriopus californicus]XP_059085088.1 homeobox protein 2-like [Tigriopus californicus]XP_059085089.1 homeobox protein 2-like [Tigriopus californicus]TRY80012.1 hypothetical protein TCAL_06579 [Tigriopus californicus]